MKILTRNETAAFLLEHDRYAIVSHCRPDGDTVGSTAALCHILRKLGKTAYVLTNPEITPRYAWLHEGISKETIGEGDTVITVDIAAPRMLPRFWEPRQIHLRVDHHEAAASFTDAELVEPKAAACAEIIFDLMEPLGVEMDRDIARAIYVGTSTDTGCFRFSNTTEHSFLTAAACLRAGAEVFQLNQTLFETNTLAKMKLQSWIIENMKLLKGGSMALVAIPKAVEENLGITEDDMDNISNYPRTIEGVCVAATLRQTRSGGTKISVRAIPGYDATQITAAFGGGGHKGAAGASVPMPLQEAAAAVEKAMLEMGPYQTTE